MVFLTVLIVTLLDTPVSSYKQLKDMSGSPNMGLEKGFLSQGVYPFNTQVDKKILSQKAEA